MRFYRDLRISRNDEEVILITNISLRAKNETQTENSPTIAAGGKLARKKEINFELKFCAKFSLELSEMDASLTVFLGLDGKINENLW